MNEINNNSSIIDELSRYKPSFKHGFSQRVIQKIESQNNEAQINSYSNFYSLFRWIALSGAAAIIALLISVYMVDGSLNSEALFGIFYYTPDEPTLYTFNL